MRPLVTLAMLACLVMTGCNVPSPEANTTPSGSTQRTTPVASTQTTQGTQTPALQPAPVTHVGERVTANVSAEGGNVTSPDGLLNFVFPAGGSRTSFHVTIEVRDKDVLPLGAPPAFGPVYEVGSDQDEWSPTGGTNDTLPQATLTFGGSTIAPGGLAPVLPAVSLDPLTGDEADADWAANVDLTPDHLKVGSYVRRPGLIYFTQPRLWLDLSPQDKTVFVGDTFEADASFSRASDSNALVTEMSPWSQRPVDLAPGTSDLTHSTGVPSPNPAQSYTFKYACGSEGEGGFGASLAVKTPLANGKLPDKTSRFTFLYPAHCVDRPTFSALLQPPVTRFTLDPRVFGSADPTYEWKPEISCGVFTIEPVPPPPSSGTSFVAPTLHAGWAHPNANDPNAPPKDENGDGVPDTCPHSETPNFSHPGNTTIVLTYRTFHKGFASRAECTYEGSLSGNGTCRADSYIVPVTR